MNDRALAVALGRPSWLDHDLIRYMQVVIILIGCAFWTMAQLQTEAFNVNTFGRVALLFPAEFWAGWMASSSLMVWLGLIQPKRRWMIAVGAASQTVQYMALGYSAIVTGGEPVIGLHCTALFAPAFMLIFWKAVTGHDT